MSNPTTEAVSDDRLRNTRAWAAVRVGSLSGAEVIVAACDEALAARSSPEPAPAVATEGSDKLLHITGAWSGRHVWTIGRMEFVELRDVLDVMRTPSPEPRDERIDWMWRWIDRITCGQCSVQEGLSVLTYSPDAPPWVQKMKSSDPLPPVRASK